MPKFAQDWLIAFAVLTWAGIAVTLFSKGTYKNKPLYVVIGALMLLCVFATEFAWLRSW
jgi:hypothetical protein